uniref:2-oxo-4-hydroxy-4-carboxy-5-ureidoimidazoline decarboxylase n=1 Tax=Scylla olivacea TaxID=85551 RepID=A0A0P4WQ62_SCYOL
MSLPNRNTAPELTNVCRLFAGREGILRNLARIGNLPSSQNPQSRESYQEQRSVGLHDLTKEERSMLDSLNNDYYRKFGFPFVICVRLNRKEAILQKCAKRLHSTAAMELHTGVEEVKKIALLLLKNLVIEKLDSKL